MTAKLVEQLPPRNKTYLKFDAMVPGFGVKVLPSGIKSYIYRYRIAGIEREMTIGRASAIKVDQAREIASKHYLAVKDGVDPLAKRETDAQTLTISELYDRYVQSKPFRLNTLRAYNASANKYIKPLLGRLVIGTPDLSGRIIDLHDGLRGTPAAANQVVKILKAMFEFAMKKLWIDRNPVIVDKHETLDRHDAMSIEEAAAAWVACEEYVAKYERAGRKWSKLGYAFQMLLATGCRKSEIITHLAWENITDERITIPWELHKTGSKSKKDIVIYQTDLTRQILSKLPRESKWVFGIGEQRFPADANTTTEWRLVLRLAGITKNYRVHDIRHTVASLCGTDRTMTLKDVSLLLNHTNMKTTERYVEYFDTAKADASARAGGLLQRVYTGGRQ